MTSYSDNLIITLLSLKKDNHVYPTTMKGYVGSAAAQVKNNISTVQRCY